MQGADFAAFAAFDLKAKVIKALAIVGVLTAMCIGSYLYGAHNTNNHWEAKIANQKTAVADRRAENATNAGQRLREYTRTEVELEVAVEQAKQQIHDYYKANPPAARVVEKIKLVPVPGKEEYVYVPVGVCPNDFLNADELRLWNLGNKGNFTDPIDPK